MLKLSARVCLITKSEMAVQKKANRSAVFTTQCYSNQLCLQCCILDIYVYFLLGQKVAHAIFNSSVLVDMLQYKYMRVETKNYF